MLDGEIKTTASRALLAIIHTLTVAVVGALLYYVGTQALFDRIVAPFIDVRNLNYLSAFVYAFQIAILLAVLLFNHRFFGIQLGTSITKKNLARFFLISTIVLACEILFLLFSGKSPYSGSSWQFYVLGPILEELLFRAVVFSGVHVVLVKSLSQNMVGWATVFVSSFAFSASHFLNAGSLSLGFVFFQVSYALAFGVLFGYFRMRTESIFPGLVLHITVNTVGMVLF